MNGSGEPPLVSIIVPSFRMAHFLPEMLDSTLAQDYRPLEIIVADGGSDDGTVDVLRGYAARHPEVRWISERDEGPADAVNRGLAMARGEILAIQSADDLYKPGALSAAVAAFLRAPDCGLVYGDVEFVDLTGAVRRVRRFHSFSWESFFAISATLAQGSVLFRRDVQQAVGGWNASYYGCDLDYWLRLALNTRAMHLPTVLSSWRIYPGQRTNPEAFASIWDGYWRMIGECDALKRAPWRIRRLARASCHLLALRYHPSPSGWPAFGHMLMGLALHPTALRYQPWQRFARALPGSTWLRRLTTGRRAKA